jgi:hypothetical protein
MPAVNPTNQPKPTPLFERINPFRMHHKPRTTKQRLGTDDDYKLTWERRILPGAGAGQYAWETYGLPPYAVFGFGNINVTNPLRETSPASYVFQSVGIVGLPPKSVLQGQFTTQPLLDPGTAANLGIVVPGAIQQSPNAIVGASPLLGP